MVRINRRNTSTQVFSPITSARIPNTTTHEGGAGYSRDARSELFALGVSLLSGEKTFYESADDRNARFMALVRYCTQNHPVWTATFLHWLRQVGNIRTASIIGAAEFVKAWGELRCAASGLPTCQNPVNYWASDGVFCEVHYRERGIAMSEIHPRQVVNSVLVRADEPGEMVSYWLQTYGRALPMPLKRGVADAAIRLGSERNLLKYDKNEAAVRWAHVLNLTHPKPRADWQDELFGYVTALPYDGELVPPESLAMLGERRSLMATPVDRRRALLGLPGTSERFQRAGMTWEALAGWLQSEMDAAAWEAIIPAMGYMGLLRNLANFDRTGISDDVARVVAAVLADPQAVARSRQFPYRFFSAYLAAPSDRWGHALGLALDAAVHNIPQLAGRTLVLADTSGSMQNRMSDKSTMTRAQVAALFAVALSHRCGHRNVHLVGYADRQFRHELALGGSVLKQTERFTARLGEVGHGTYTGSALARSYTGEDRVVIITDGQSHDNVATAQLNSVPPDVPIYTFTLGGYRATHLPMGSDNRHELTGLTDATFRMIPLLEAGRNADWDAVFGSETVQATPELVAVDEG